MHKSMEEQKRKHGQDHQEAKKIRRTFTQREKKQREVTVDSKETDKRAMDSIDSQVKMFLIISFHNKTKLIMYITVLLSVSLITKDLYSASCCII